MNSIKKEKEIEKYLNTMANFLNLEIKVCKKSYKVKHGVPQITVWMNEKDAWKKANIFQALEDLWKYRMRESLFILPCSTKPNIEK